MNWNLFSGLRTREEVREGKALQASLQSRLKQEELRVIQELARASARVNESVEDLRASQRVLEEAKESMELGEARYNNGLSDPWSSVTRSSRGGGPIRIWWRRYTPTCSPGPNSTMRRAPRQRTWTGGSHERNDGCP
jgi:hypothetical protein